MTEKEILISHCVDKIHQAINNSMIVTTDFISVDERSKIVSLEKRFNKDVNFFYYGGYESAERTVAYLVPEYFDFYGDCTDLIENYPDSNPIVVIKINKDKFTSLGHRDYLGSLMGLGVKRSMIGDILVFDWGAYVFVNEGISGYICENLVNCGRASVKCEVISVDLVDLPEIKTEIRFHSVASMRLDNILSTGFGLSRSACASAISAGIVYVNSQRAEKNDMHIKINDKIVVRGKGKIVVDSIIGKTRKDRIHLNIKHFN